IADGESAIGRQTTAAGVVCGDPLEAGAGRRGGGDRLGRRGHEARSRREGSGTRLLAARGGIAPGAEAARAELRRLPGPGGRVGAVCEGRPGPRASAAANHSVAPASEPPHLPGTWRPGLRGLEPEREAGASTLAAWSLTSARILAAIESTANGGK